MIIDFKFAPLPEGDWLLTGAMVNSLSYYKPVHLLGQPIYQPKVGETSSDNPRERQLLSLERHLAASTMFIKQCGRPTSTPDYIRKYMNSGGKTSVVVLWNESSDINIIN